MLKFRHFRAFGAKEMDLMNKVCNMIVHITGTEPEIKYDRIDNVYGVYFKADKVEEVIIHREILELKVKMIKKKEEDA